MPLRDRPAHKTSDMFHNMETVDYNLSNDDNMNLSDVETVQYDDSEIQLIPLKNKKSSKHIAAKKIPKKYRKKAQKQHEDYVGFIKRVPFQP